MANGDPIRAVILNTGLNQDGKTETITAPSAVAQEALIRDVYDKAGVSPAETSFFEAHGTGTPTGDPLEISAISAVFSKTRTAQDPLLIGSVKTNIGHTETSSGLASIIRTALAMEKGLVPRAGPSRRRTPRLNSMRDFSRFPNRFKRGQILMAYAERPLTTSDTVVQMLTSSWRAMTLSLHLTAI